jgi:hypothetical protein
MFHRRRNGRRPSQLAELTVVVTESLPSHEQVYLEQPTREAAIGISLVSDDEAELPTDQASIFIDLGPVPPWPATI